MDRRAGAPRPRKRLGQHFLEDRGVLARISGALELTGVETVIEIGSGRGALTDRLVAGAGRVVGVELDGALADLLRTRYASAPTVSIVEADILDVSPSELAGGGPYLLAGNVPYYITTPILFHVLRPPAPTRAVFLVQREVAERVVSPPGSRVYGALSVNVQALAVATLVAIVPPRAFRPPPTVESAILVVTPRVVPLVSPDEQDAFSAWIVAVFGLRRKQMARIIRTLTSLGASAADALLMEAGIDPTDRPETLSPEVLARIYRRCASA